jgi:hypothetical protein
VDTPDGVRTASHVVELEYFPVNAPARGEMHDTTGQALYLDLGLDHRPMIALLTHIRWDDEVAQNGHLYHYRCLGESPFNVLADACLGGAGNLGWVEMATRFNEHWRKPTSILPGNLPDLVTSTDLKDPKSVVLVDPFHLTATLRRACHGDR